MGKFNLINGVTSIGGFGVTVLLAVKETPGYFSEKGELKDKSFSSVAKCVVRHYYPAMIVGGLTVGSMVTGAIINNKTQASLIAAAGSGYGLYKRYGDEVKKKLGIDTHKSILSTLAQQDIDKFNKDVPNGCELYWNDIIGHFVAKPEDLEKTRYDINKFMIAPGYFDVPAEWVSIQDFLEMCKAKQYEDNIAFPYVGWSADVIYDNCCTGEPNWVNIEISEDYKVGLHGQKYKVVYFNTELIGDKYDENDEEIADAVNNLLEDNTKGVPQDE